MERHQRKALRALPAEKAHPHADRRLCAHGGQRLHRAGVRHHAQKYLLGVTDEQYDAIVAEKFKNYVGSPDGHRQPRRPAESPSASWLRAA